MLVGGISLNADWGAYGSLFLCPYGWFYLVRGYYWGYC